jgi:urease accessory protein
MSRQLLIATLAASAFFAGPDIAAAHGSIEGVGSFYGGLLHPLLVPVHVLLLLAAGLWLGQQSMERVRPTASLFGLFLAGGLVLSLLAPEGILNASLLLALAALAGTLASANLTLPQPIVITLAALVALAVGIDSPPESGTIRSTVMALAGTWISANYLVYLIVALVSLTTRAWMKIGVRVLGSWTAASAVLVLALEFRR